MSKSTTHSFRFLFAILIAVAIFVQTYAPTVHADAIAQSLPFTQNWSNAGLITADDDWSGVPGIIGYRGDNLTSATGADPQSIITEGTPTIDVNANRSDPDTFISGGVAEFDGIANPVVALNGSGTADAPNIVISLNTSGQTNINASYNVRDIDGSVDNAIQPVALQYRVGSTGNFTNIPAGFVADGTTGPSLATLVTPVSVTLPAACENQALLQLRIITANANGNDEWVGIDDINVTSGGTGPVSLSGVGSSSPHQVNPGGISLLTVAVTPATQPASTGIAVSADLSNIAGSSTQQFFDDGTHGDVTAGDNTFSFSASVPVNAPPGGYVFGTFISDAQSRTAIAPIGLDVVAVHNPSEHLVMGNPSDATADVANFDNYLISRTQYVESYNMTKGEPNWVSWHLDSTWIGTTPRQDDYRPDTSLPAGWYQVQANDYSGSGFDRGHMCPSADRTSSVADNSATFLMTNFVPQAPNNNQGPWEDLESYERQLVAAGNELYVIAGPAGVGGTGSLGGVTNTIAGGHVVVPAYTWKVIVVLPVGDNDAFRVTKGTRTIAVIMPNVQSIGLSTTWPQFRVPIQQVQELTGYHFLTNVRRSVLPLVTRQPDYTQIPGGRPAGFAKVYEE